jgi:hypothetical protein
VKQKVCVAFHNVRLLEYDIYIVLSDRILCRKRNTLIVAIEGILTGSLLSAERTGNSDMSCLMLDATFMCVKNIPLNNVAFCPVLKHGPRSLTNMRV